MARNEQGRDQGDVNANPNKKVLVGFLVFKSLVGVAALYLLVVGVLAPVLVGVLLGLTLAALVALSIWRSMLLLRGPHP
jgi:hypothetical protein